MREICHKEYNRLTKQFLEKGYTAECHPDYVKIEETCDGKKSLDNVKGGFTFERGWIFKQTFKTPCGLQCKGRYCYSSMSYMGIDWTYENDMAVIHCPYDKYDCTLKHEYLQKPRILRFQCNVHMVEEEYRYEGSVEDIQKQHDDEMRRKEIFFGRQRNGHVCRTHMRFDRDIQEWEMNYDPYYCGVQQCTGMCSVLGRELDKKRGNVFYDVKIRQLRTDLDGTLFEGQIDTSIIKGRKLFKHPVSMDIARICAKLCQDRIRNQESGNYSVHLYLSEYHGIYFSFEILNIRAERRESRDLMQDLADIREGFRITHASDVEKREAENKKARRRNAHMAKIRRLEKKIREEGYQSLKEYSAEYRYADKWLGPERIAELEELHLKKEKEEREQPVQMSLFDMENGITGTLD